MRNKSRRCGIFRGRRIPAGGRLGRYQTPEAILRTGSVLHELKRFITFEQRDQGQRLSAERPALALQLLRGIGRELSGRIRSANRLASVLRD